MNKTRRISPLWWPVLALLSPVLALLLLIENRRFSKNRDMASQVNQERIRKAKPLDLPELEIVSFGLNRTYDLLTKMVYHPQ